MFSSALRIAGTLAETSLSRAPGKQWVCTFITFSGSSMNVSNDEIADDCDVVFCLSERGESVLCGDLVVQQWWTWARTQWRGRGSPVPEWTKPGRAASPVHGAWIKKHTGLRWKECWDCIAHLFQMSKKQLRRHQARLVIHSSMHLEPRNKNTIIWENNIRSALPGKMGFQFVNHHRRLITISGK